MDVFSPPRWMRRDWMGVSHLLEKHMMLKENASFHWVSSKWQWMIGPPPSLHSAAWKPRVMWLAWRQNCLGWQKPSLTKSFISLGWNTVNVHLLLLGVLWISFPWFWSDARETPKGKPHRGHDVWDTIDHRGIFKLSSGSSGSSHQMSASEAKEYTIWGLVIPL